MRMFLFAALLSLPSATGAVASPLVDCNSDDPPRVIKGCTELVPQNRGNKTNLSVLYNRRGMAKNKQGNVAGAIEDYSAALSANRGNAQAWLNRGRAHFRLGKNEKAIEDTTQAISLQPSAPAHELRALARASMPGLRQPDRILSDVDRALELNRASLLARYARSIVSSAQYQNQAALDDMTAVILLDGKEAWQYRARAEYYLYVDDVASAEKDLNTAETLDPTAASLYGGRASVAIYKGKYAEAAAMGLSRHSCWSGQTRKLDTSSPLACFEHDYSRRCIGDGKKCIFRQLLQKRSFLITHI